MSKEQQLVALIKKWGSHKIAFPESWSDDRQLSSANISYKTYSGGDNYKNIVVTVDGVLKYDINLRYDKIEVTHPLSSPISVAKALELVTLIYQEATSMESIVEGKANLRQKIADTKKKIRELNKELSKLNNQLSEDE